MIDFKRALELGKKKREKDKTTQDSSIGMVDGVALLSVEQRLVARWKYRQPPLSQSLFVKTPPFVLVPKAYALAARLGLLRVAEARCIAYARAGAPDPELCVCRDLVEAFK